MFYLIFHKSQFAMYLFNFSYKKNQIYGKLWLVKHEVKHKKWYWQFILRRNHAYLSLSPKVKVKVKVKSLTYGHKLIKELSTERTILSPFTKKEKKKKKKIGQLFIWSNWLNQANGWELHLKN